jgi:hypothetical protein
MRVLLAVLLVAGTGVADDGPSSFDEGTSPIQVRTDAIGSTDDPPTASGDASAVAALKKLGARIKQDDQGNVVELNLSRSKITDAGLLHLKGLTGLQHVCCLGWRAATIRGMECSYFGLVDR